MTEKVEIFTTENKFIFENNINGDICEEDKECLVYLEYYENEEGVYDAFSYDDAVKLRDFLDALIKQADKECATDA